jgi:hypothetical protein
MSPISQADARVTTIARTSLPAQLRATSDRNATGLGFGTSSLRLADRNMARLPKAPTGSLGRIPMARYAALETLKRAKRATVALKENPVRQTGEGLRWFA